MEFHEKLQELRKQKGMTQEELASQLFVSRTAISKWESGRGYPSIESLRAIAKFFGITVDGLLSSETVLALAEQDVRKRENRFRDLACGFLDLCMAFLLFFPFFAVRADGAVQAASLLALADVPPYLTVTYFSLVIGMILWGILTLALQSCETVFWQKCKSGVSLVGGAAAVLFFTVSLQPYAAAFTFVLLMIKVLIKRWRE